MSAIKTPGRAGAGRIRLLNWPALIIMTSAVVLALIQLFPKQPAFRDPRNLHAQDQLSIAYMRVLVRADPANVALRLSYVKLLTEAGLDNDAENALIPILRQTPAKYALETGLAHVRLSLQRMYRGSLPEPEVAVIRRQVVLEFHRLLALAQTENAENSVLHYAEVFGEPGVLADLHEKLARDPRTDDTRKAEQLSQAARYRLASGLPLAAARLWWESFHLLSSPDERSSAAVETLHAFLSASELKEGFKAAKEFTKSFPDKPEILSLAADIAEQRNENESALKWLHVLFEQQSDDAVLHERLLRLEVTQNHLTEALALANSMSKWPSLSDAQRELLAHVFDWNSAFTEALSQWFPLAMTSPNAEREQRAFELARSLGQDELLCRLVENAMQLRHLRPEESTAYIFSGLRRFEPQRLQDNLDKYLTRYKDDRNALAARAHLSSLRGDADEAVAAWQRLQSGSALGPEERMWLAEDYWRNNRAEAALNVLLSINKPVPEQAASYWHLLADIAWYLERDALAKTAYEQVLAQYAPADGVAIARLFARARRSNDSKEIERWAQYGWQNLHEREYFISLMELAYNRHDTRLLDNYLREADNDMRTFSSHPKYWQYHAERWQAVNKEADALSALKQLSRISLHDASVVNAYSWTLLAQNPQPKPDIYQLLIAEEFLAKDNPALIEAMAAMQQTLAQPAKAAEWFRSSLKNRHHDFFWVLALADNLEWLGCGASANQARLLALNNLAVSKKTVPAFSGNPSYAERFYGRLNPHFSRPADEDKWNDWQSITAAWTLDGVGLDNAQYYALHWLLPRLKTSAWRDLAQAFREHDETEINRLVMDMQRHLQLSSHEPDADLPMSLNEVAGKKIKTKDLDKRDATVELPLCISSLGELRRLSEPLPVETVKK